MQCPKCQFENPEEMQFCGKCGEKLAGFCPKCRFQNPSDFVFCGKCGLALKEASVSSAIDYSEPQSYTPKFLADKILTTRSSIEGERKLVTVLFADVANYTAMSEKLDPEDVHQIMDGCFNILIDEIHRYEGTINQFTGDGVMALFGAPLAHEDHAQRACYAALSIQRALENYSEKIKHDYNLDFKMRVGLNSGPVVVGSIGDDLRMDYTAVGDTTNLASRLENMASPDSILASQDTFRLVRDFFEFEILGPVEVKGKEEPQEAFELIKASGVETRIGAAVAKGLTRFVGRKNSMAALKEAFDGFLSGSGQVVGVHRRPDGSAGGQPQTDHASCIGDREGFCLPHFANDHRAAGRAQNQSPQPSGFGIHLREKPLSGAGIYLQTCPHARGRLQQLARKAAKRDPQKNRESHRRDLCEEIGRVLRDAGLSFRQGTDVE